MLPLLELKRFDQYTTTHACNVSVLAMGLAERLGLGRQEVRSFGVAGLLHDIGKTRIPNEILVKPGKLTEAERHVMGRHPVEGARIVLERERGLGLAAVVAYEHHVCIDGTGYPHFHFARGCHLEQHGPAQPVGHDLADREHDATEHDQHARGAQVVGEIGSRADGDHGRLIR